LAENDNNNRGQGSYHDSFLDYFVHPGAYFVFIGTPALSSTILSDPHALTIEGSNELLACGEPVASYATYQVTLSGDSFDFVDGPETQRPSTCGHPSKNQHNECPYHVSQAMHIEAQVSGTLHGRGYEASKDRILFEITSTGTVAIDVLSFQEDDHGQVKSLDHVCGRAYIDTVLYIFRHPAKTKKVADGEYSYLDPSTLVAKAHSRDKDLLETHMSVSTRDPYVQLALPPGWYTLVVGQQHLSLLQAIQMLYPNRRNEESPLLCGRPHPYGHYHVFFWTERFGAVRAKAPGTFNVTSCKHEICSSTY
jgi:hypothetical protein